MNWTDIIINIASADVEKTTAIAEMFLSRGVYIEDYSDFDTEIQKFGPVEIIDSELLQKDRTRAKVHLYFSPDENPMETLPYLEERLKASAVPYAIESATVKEDDWANNWKKYFRPMPIGEKLLIVPSWLTEDPELEQYPGRARLIIDPGMAFGSGQHETTRLCMEMIERHITPGASVLDMGTGSGVLAISALLLGAGSALGVDIDPLSVRVAGENAELNGVGGRFTPLCGDLAEDVTGRYDLICANIVADIIIRLSPEAGRLLAPGGKYIMSGIIAERKPDVLACLGSLGLKVIDIKEDRGWVAIAAAF